MTLSQARLARVYRLKAQVAAAEADYYAQEPYRTPQMRQANAEFHRTQATFYADMATEVESDTWEDAA